MTHTHCRPRWLARIAAGVTALVLGVGSADDTAPLGGRSLAQPAAAAVVVLDGTAALSTVTPLPSWPASYGADTMPACAGGDWYWRVGVGAPPTCGDDHRVPAAALRCLAARADLARDGFVVLAGLAQLDAPWRGAGTRWGAPAPGQAGDLACAADLPVASLPFPVIAPATQPAWSAAASDRPYALDFTAAPFDDVVTVFHPAFVAAWHAAWTASPVRDAAASAVAALTPAREDALSWALRPDHAGGEAAHGAWVAFAAQPPASLPAAWAAQWAQLRAAPADGPSPHGEALVEALRVLRGDGAVPGAARQSAPGVSAAVATGSRAVTDATRYRSPLDTPCRHALLVTLAAGAATADEDFGADLLALPLPRPACADVVRCLDVIAQWLAEGLEVTGRAHRARAQWVRLGPARTREDIAAWPVSAAGARAAHLDVPALADLGPHHHLQAVVPWGDTALAIAVQPSPAWQWDGAVREARATSDGTALRWADSAGAPLVDDAGHLAAGTATGLAAPFMRSLPVADGTLPGGPWWFVGTTLGTLDAYAGSPVSRRWSWTPPAPAGAAASRHPRWADHRAHGLDGDPVRIDIDGRKLIVMGRGRGDRGYHAVDVTDPGVPRAAWSFGPAEWTADGPSAFGESIAAPVRARITLPSLGARDVLVIPGGEDPTLRGGRPRADADRAGAAVHLIDAASGQRLWTWAADAAADTVVPALQFSMVATPRTLDEDRDGLADWLLVGDAWGTVSIIDVRAAAPAAAWGAWTVVARLSDGGRLRAAFHLALTAVRLPTAARMPPAWLVVAGAGHLPDLSVGDTGALYAWRVMPQRPSAITLADLVEIGTDGRALGGGTAATASGWRMALEGDREQVTAPPRISGGELLVATWQPPTITEDADCRRQPGIARLRSWRLPAPPPGAERVIYPEDPREHALPGAVPARQVTPWTPPASAVACTGTGCTPQRHVIAGGRIVALGPLPPARRTVWRALPVTP